ncbi:hypothetical protein JDV02_010237 [Purpureocillium takamizusanense]|uniref:Cyclohexanone monooxygenase n=1 Tax=Purpureocillium takamizusanense TaxID=2060973 RepID=A0A9Q8VH76_9HYPO|nr:uncharacterized protein JDV02_010237 [Purpureocillium takamizusanense]UNI24497.1 hypothetical protein JDV02_010237 [Purpureocillium takamizusanense]
MLTEINSYLKGVVRYFDLDRFIAYNSKVVSARWSTETCTWTVEVENGPSVESEILINACGILNNPKMPEITGLDTFAGQILHTAAWDQSVDLRNKRIGIIGAGASSIQLLPQIQPTAEKVQVFIRTPSWIYPPFALTAGTAASHAYSEEEKETFRWDEDSYLEARKVMEGQFNGMFRIFIKNSLEQKAMRAKVESHMRSIIKDHALQEQLIPKFEMGCRRINPGDSFLVAIQKPNVEPVLDPVDKITEIGVIAGGKLYEADVLVAATGFNTSFRPRFPIIGLDGINLQDLWADEPVSYMGTGVSGFPNYLIFLGPNTPISNGSLMGRFRE